MRKYLRFFLFVLSFHIGLCGFAQAMEVDVDSLLTNLDEIVVEGRTQRILKNGAEYVPGKKMKKAAFDGTSLLRMMQIPTLDISPLDGSIKLITQQDVSVFINFTPANREDLKAMKTEDVKSVEVLDYPTDPRFQGAQHVINFIMKEYEWGGYTKAFMDGTTLANNEIGGGLYQKFNYHKLRLDASVSASGSWDDTYKEQTTETYRHFLFNDLKVDELFRSSESERFRGRDNNQKAFIRAIYSNPKYYLEHNISFTRTATPIHELDGIVSYSKDILPDSPFTEHSDTQSIDITADGTYQFNLPKSNTLMMYWSFSHSANRNNSFYFPEEFFPIENRIKEKAYSPVGALLYQKELSHNNSIGAIISTDNNIYKDLYTGTTESLQRLTSSNNAALLHYSQYFDFGLNIFLRAGAGYSFYRLNGINYNKRFTPQTIISLQYRTRDTRHGISLESSIVTTPAKSNMTNEAIIRDNILLWMAGNSNLKMTKGLWTALNYTFLPINQLSLAASMHYNYYYNYPIEVYAPLSSGDGMQGMLKSFSDDCRQHRLVGVISATARLMRNSLILSASGHVFNEKLTGIISNNITYFHGKANASYYLGPFSATLFYNFPYKNNNAYGKWYRIPSSYGLMLTLAVKNLKAELKFNNWLGKRAEYSYYESQYYSSVSKTFMPDLSRNISLSLSYTISYGKELSKDNEATNKAIHNSAIMR
ncbi:MAG: hypothetical protein HDS82_03675 [Bacteroidales bacterium]|nr:hypothetical protein [Bacteroidales bacterium]